MSPGSTPLPELGAQAAAEFTKAYGRAPQWIAAAPGRVNLIGEHTDYNDGFVLPMAIERYTVIAAAPTTDGSTRIRLRTTGGQPPAEFDIAYPLAPAPKGSWHNYPMGVIVGFFARGVNLVGFDALIQSNVPLGGGLSSSAALEVATATLLETMTGKSMDPMQKALLAQKAEHEFAGVPCGIMDQAISVMGREGHALLLDCRSYETELVPLTDPAVTVLIINTNVKHELTGGEYAQRRSQCEEAAGKLGVRSLRDADTALLTAKRAELSDVVFRRARHVMGEIERTTLAAAAARAADWASFGKLMYASHNSLRDDYEVSCAELDAVVEIAEGIGEAGGVIGCRMTGGGFGGCAVALVQTSVVTAISAKLAVEYEKRTKIKPTLFVTRPAAGATVLSR